MVLQAIGGLRHEALISLALVRLARRTGSDILLSACAGRDVTKVAYQLGHRILEQGRDALELLIGLGQLIF